MMIATRLKENVMRHAPILALALSLGLSSVACDTYGPSGNTGTASVAPSCTDDVKNGTETDINCGGTCKPCGKGMGCLVTDDCGRDYTCDATHHCTASNPSTCGNGVKDPGETDVDCGGNCVNNCGIGKGCSDGTDCVSGSCVAGKCAEAMSNDPCKNGVRDATEVDVDCGGSCGTKCGDGKICVADADCASNRCVAGKCAAAVVDSCMDGVKGPDESDVDCGGKQCPTCSIGKSCKAHTDCYTNACDLGVAKCSAAVVLSGLKPLVCPNGAFVMIGWVTGPNPTKSDEANGTLRILRNGVVGHVNVSATCDGKYVNWDGYRGKSVKDLGGKVTYDGVDITDKVKVCASTPNTGPGDKIALPMEPYLYGTCPQ